MKDCVTTRLRFETPSNLALEAAFDGGRLTSDGGLAWLFDVDEELGLCEEIAKHVPEWRKRKGRHSLVTLVRQRLFQIACGYEDQNDSDALRSDPLLKLVCGSPPETGADLASQPTISRLENAASASACYRIAETIFELYLRRRSKGGAPEEGAFGLRFDRRPYPRRTGRLLLPRLLRAAHVSSPARLRWRERAAHQRAVKSAGNTHASRAAVALLRRIVARLRRRWPGVKIELRADAGFAVPAIYDYCDKEGIDYTVGLITNARLEALAEGLLDEAKERYEAEGEKARLFGEDTYQAGSWERKRRVIYKAEAMEQGTNTRFVVTSRSEVPKELYEWYVRRGESENWIKDFKLALKADRLSCHRFIAKQFRLLLHAAAYWLLDTLRGRLVRRGVRRLQLDTLRLLLIKIGGRVRQLLTKGAPLSGLWASRTTSLGCSRE